MSVFISRTSSEKSRTLWSRMRSTTCPSSSLTPSVRCQRYWQMYRRGVEWIEVCIRRNITWNLNQFLRAFLVFWCLPLPQGIVSDQERKKMKRKGDRYSMQTSLIVATLKRLLPVGLNICAPGEQELIALAKNRFTQVAKLLLHNTKMWQGALLFYSSLLTIHELSLISGEMLTLNFK